MSFRERLPRVLLIGMLVFLSSCAVTQTHFRDTLELARLKDGVYVGEDSVPLCNVKLAVTIKEGRISDIKILSHFVSYPLAERAYTIIPKRIIEKQSLDVDAVTGATISSNNIKKALQDALKKAQG